MVQCKSALLNDGYIAIAAIDNCCAPMEVKCTLFVMHLAPLLLGTSGHEAIQVTYTTRTAFLTDSYIYFAQTSQPFFALFL